MSDHPRIGVRRGRTVEVDLAHWPGVDHNALPEDRRAQYLRRRRAVEMYLSGAPVDGLGVASLVEVVVFVGVVLLGLLHAGRRGLLNWDLR